MIRRLLFAFIAGFVSTLVFHQLVLAVLHGIGVAPNAPYAMRAVPPFGVPAVISLAFWGGVWGIIMIPIVERQRGAAFYVAAIVFGAIFPTLVAWFVAAPLKGQPMAGGWKPLIMMIGPIVNAAWGLGTALIYRLFRH